jgi:hypothetical protein
MFQTFLGWIFLFIQLGVFTGVGDSVFDIEVLLQAHIGVKMVPRLECWYSPLSL